MEKKALKNHPKRRIVLSKTIEAQTVWRYSNPTIQPHIDLGKAEVSYLTFTNTVIQFITDIVQVFEPIPHSNKGCIPITLLVKNNVYDVSILLSCTHALINDDVCIL